MQRQSGPLFETKRNNRLLRSRLLTKALFHIIVSSLIGVCCFIQKHNRRKAAKEHVRQKLQEHTGLTPQSVRSDLQADDDHAKPDGIPKKINKCCVSFKLSSLGSGCSCRTASAEGTGVCRVSDAGSDVSEKNQEFVANITDVQVGNLSVNSENLQPESHVDEPWELLGDDADQIKPTFNQPDICCSMLTCNSISDEQIAAIEYCDTDWQTGDRPCLTQRHLVVATPENVSKQCRSDLRVSAKSDSQERSSLIVDSVSTSQKLQYSNSQNTSAAPVISSGCELNFSSMDDDLFACFPDSFPCDLYSSETDTCKKDFAESVCHSIEFDHNAAIAIENAEKRESSVSVDDTLSLCRALSVVKIAMAESVNSGITDFILPDSQYGEIIQLKVSDKGSTVEKNMVERMAHTDSIGSSLSHSLQSSQSSAGWLSRRQLRQKQRLVCCSVFSFCFLVCYFKSFNCIIFSQFQIINHFFTCFVIVGLVLETFEGRQLSQLNLKD